MHARRQKRPNLLLWVKSWKKKCGKPKNTIVIFKVYVHWVYITLYLVAFFLLMKPPLSIPLLGVESLLISTNYHNHHVDIVLFNHFKTHNYYALLRIVKFLGLPILDLLFKRTARLSAALHLDPKQFVCRKLSRPRGSNWPRKTPSAIMVRKLPWIKNLLRAVLPIRQTLQISGKKYIYWLNIRVCRINVSARHAPKYEKLHFSCHSSTLNIANIVCHLPKAGFPLR